MSLLYNLQSWTIPFVRVHSSTLRVHKYHLKLTELFLLYVCIAEPATKAAESKPQPATTAATSAPQPQKSAPSTTSPPPREMPPVPSVPKEPLSVKPVGSPTPAPVSAKPSAAPAPAGAPKKGTPGIDYISGSRAEQRVKMSRMRLRIASRLKEAQNTAAMLTTFNECDLRSVPRNRHTQLAYST